MFIFYLNCKFLNLIINFIFNIKIILFRLTYLKVERPSAREKNAESILCTKLCNTKKEKIQCLL